MPLLDQLSSTLETRRQKGTLRRLTNFTPRSLVGVPGTPPHQEVPSSSSSDTSSSSTSSPAPSPLADFSSNDYLSLATSQQLKDAFLARVMRPGARVGGSTGSRLLDGNNGGEMDALESRLCSFFHSSAALLTPSGWEANVSLFTSLPQPGDLILYDSLIHASVHDGMRRSRARCLSFEHNNLMDFERLLDEQVLPTLEKSGANLFLAVESLYSMDGDFSPLPKLIEIARRRTILAKGSGRFWIVVDEAHAGGCFGFTGQGMCQEWGLTGLESSQREEEEEEGLIRVATFGKGFGVAGAVILCPPLVREYLINYARPLIFSTAQAHSSLLLIHAALDVLDSSEGARRRESLARNCRLLKKTLQEALGCEPDGGEALLNLNDVGINDNDDDARQPLLPTLSHTHSGESRRDQDLYLPTRAICNTLPSTPSSSSSSTSSYSSSNVSSTSTSTSLYSPILPLLTPHSLTRPLASHLQREGYLVRPITYPTVPLGRDRLRICVHADNTSEEIQGLGSTLKRWLLQQQPQTRTRTRTRTLEERQKSGKEIGTSHAEQGQVEGKTVGNGQPSSSSSSSTRVSRL